MERGISPRSTDEISSSSSSEDERGIVAFNSRTEDRVGEDDGCCCFFFVFVLVALPLPLPLDAPLMFFLEDETPCCCFVAAVGKLPLSVLPMATPLLFFFLKRRMVMLV